MLRPSQLLLLLLLLNLAFCPGSWGLAAYTRLCKGLELTQLSYGVGADVAALKEELLKMVNGCEYVHGDLVLKDLGVDRYSGRILDGNIREMETDFLDSVAEITGRLVIQNVALRRVQLRNLRVIRGGGADESKPALELTMCAHLTQLLLPSLTVIARGDVRLQEVADAGLLCRLSNTVNWPALFENREQQRFSVNLSGCTSNGLPIGNCSGVCGLAATEGAFNCTDCPRNQCWSDKVCQAVSRCSLASRPCSGCYRDSISGIEECCDRDCLGGCSGPGPSACNSCSRVNYKGQCRERCPDGDYNAETMQLERFNQSLVHVGNVCAEKCPNAFVLDLSRQYCLASCPASQTPVDGNCTRCGEFDSGEANCRVCASNERNFVDSMAAELANCSVWKFSQSASVDGTIPQTSREVLSALASARYIYAPMLRITRSEALAANLSALGNLRHISGTLMLSDLKTSFLGLANLESAKQLALIRVSGLCRAWYPEQYLLSKPIRYTVVARDVTFAADDDPACAEAACDRRCRNAECWGPGPAGCVSCLGVRVRGACYDRCSEVGGYPNPSAGTDHRHDQCLPCHQQCAPGLGCEGPGPNQCFACRSYRENNVCVPACNSHLEPDSDGECYSASAARLGGLAAGLAVLVLALLALSLLGWWYYRRRVRRYEMVELDEYLTDPSNPNDMVKLLIVNNDDVVKQKEIGSGAFGTVYRGLLRTDTLKGVMELPVAVKVLRGNNPKLGQELLNEAGVLARVQHPHCVRLVALCMTAEVQLITALMPRGCLLSFLRDHRGGIGAERMLNWALQVAEGMAYLESINIIHRDLAARNVLLKSPDELKITDFGLARLLQESEREFTYTSGALPVKWLGIECFESGVFSHKSDVWSYGVLLWEICSYGEAPYKPYRIASVEDITGLLRKGVRLNQPEICSVDFYNIMLACWLPYPDSRPSFSDLTASMKDCLLCPSKYIAARDTLDDEVVDMEKAELVHTLVQHQQPVRRRVAVDSADAGEEGYTPMADAAPRASVEQRRPHYINSYVNEPQVQQRQHSAGNGGPSASEEPGNADYLVPEARATAVYDEPDAGYLEPQQHQQPQQQMPVDLDDDYLAPSKG